MTTRWTRKGRLYDWETANKACPAGFRLPSDDEWTALVDYAGGEETAGTKLKSTAGWDKNGNGTNEFGFSALPGGGSREGDDDGDGSGVRAGDFGFWWSATKNSGDEGVWRRAMNYENGYVERLPYSETNTFSVRCVQN
jgi:uncharacterized protein (TIGR02145 family)